MKTYSHRALRSYPTGLLQVRKSTQRYRWKKKKTFMQISRFFFFYTSQLNAWMERTPHIAHRAVAKTVRIDKSPHWMLCRPWEHGNWSGGIKAKEVFLSSPSSAATAGSPNQKKPRLKEQASSSLIEKCSELLTSRSCKPQNLFLSRSVSGRRFKGAASLGEPGSAFTRSSQAR